MTEQKIHPFIEYLQELARKQDRRALAALRRGLGQPPGAAAEMFRYVEPFLSPSRSQAREQAYYLIASLFGLHPESTGVNNMGAHLRACIPKDEENDSIERRFTILLAAHIEDLPVYLRQAISYLKSKDIPVNWNQLFWDVQNWDEEDRRVQKGWANAFWRRTQAEISTEQNTSD